MSEKDYFGDDWTDDFVDGEGSQVDESDDLLDESFGVDSEFEVVSKDVKVTPEDDNLDIPKRPKIGILGKAVSEEILPENVGQEAGSPIPGVAGSFDNTNLGDIYFDENETEKVSAGVAVPVVNALPNVASPGGINVPKRPSASPDKGAKKVAEAVTSIEEDEPKIDLVDIVAAGLDETKIAQNVDIDFDPDDPELDTDEDFPLELSNSDDEDFEEEDEDETESDLDSDEIEEDENLVAGAVAKTAKKTSAGKRKKPGPRKKRGPKPGIRLTARDVQIMTFLARYRVATVAQLARMFDTSETALRNRLPRLEKERMVSWAWGAQSKPKLWLITRQGLQVINMTLTAPTVKWGQLRHTLGLTDLGIEFELAGEVVITEREIRAAATRYTPTARIKTAIDFMDFIKSYDEDDESGQIQRALTIPMSNRSFGHIPDMVLARQSYPNGSSGNIAIELELNRKHTSEWVAVLTAYRDTQLFELVQYYTMSKEIKRALTAIVKALGAEDKIQVHYFVPVDNTADPLVTGGK